MSWGGNEQTWNDFVAYAFLSVRLIGTFLPIWGRALGAHGSQHCRAIPSHFVVSSLSLSMIENFLRHLNHVVLCLPELKKRRKISGAQTGPRQGSLRISTLLFLTHLCASVLAFCAVWTHASKHNWLKSTSNGLAVTQALSVGNELN